jgi:broad specificity phosphatase PhoE
VTLVLLVRHGLTAATGSVLSGWTPGIPLDGRGREQARALAARLAPVPLDAVITSPLERCRQTAELIAATGEGRPSAVQEDERIGECHYGDWTGQPLKRLAREPLWRVVQAHPGAARFPGADGESICHRRQPWHAHRHAAADPGRPVLAHGDPVYAAAPVRGADERHRWRR